MNVKMWILVQNFNCISKKKKSLTIATSIFIQVKDDLIQHLVIPQFFTDTNRSGCITREPKSDFSNQEILLSAGNNILSCFVSFLTKTKNVRMKQHPKKTK